MPKKKDPESQEFDIVKKSEDDAEKEDGKKTASKAAVAAAGAKKRPDIDMEIDGDKNTVGLIYARSGIATKFGIAPANCVGVIDWDYRGELIVALHNSSENDFVINHGERIAQLVLAPVFTPEVEVVDELSDTDRGAGGFGSTNK